jgi:uncharacterized membrane protein YkvA (DUF1232 family)
MKLLFTVTKDYVTGVYTEVPWTTIAGIIGSLIYVLSPIDLVPDFLPFVGLLDDAAVLGLCLKAIDIDLQKYKIWKKDSGFKIEILPGDTDMPEPVKAEVPKLQGTLSKTAEAKESEAKIGGDSGNKLRGTLIKERE